MAEPWLALSLTLMLNVQFFRWPEQEYPCLLCLTQNNQTIAFELVTDSQ